MDVLLLSKITTPIIGWVTQLMGWVMEGVYFLLDTIGIPNIGLAIIFYTIIIYMCLLPITIKQQKQTRMMSYMQPEISKIQNKYKGRRDQESMYRMQEETNEVYAKYGTSPYGTCLPLILQLVFLMALYQVIYHIPGYISRVASIFSGLATKIISIPGGAAAFCNFAMDNRLAISGVGSVLTKTNVIDGLSLMTQSQWSSFAQIPEFSSISHSITEVAAKSDQINYFVGLNITESPMGTIQSGFSSGAWWLVILAILVPVLAWFTQWINYKLMPQNMNDASGTGASMKAMNNFMPLFSAFLCLTLSFGIGIYWIASAVVRGVQTVVINRKMMNVDIEALIKKNQEKAAKKAKKKKDQVSQSRVNEQAHTNVRRIKNAKGKYTNDTSVEYDYYEKTKDAPENSIFSKANMVRKFDEKNSAAKKKRK